MLHKLTLKHKIIEGSHRNVNNWKYFSVQNYKVRQNENFCIRKKQNTNFKWSKLVISVRLKGRGE